MKQLAFEFLLFWPGWLALKILTLGKYPRLARPIKDIEDYSDFQAISYFGLFVVLLSSALFLKFFTA
ncbi:hypothetical protein [Comamonas testosteroni]|uniref:hypothetical protein n=1 Tax=Comamonas testosteroni TaxID=285 RepID=UPI001E2F6A85|nr:hypothetical protein [Comamonas testosteroni]